MADPMLDGFWEIILDEDDDRDDLSLSRQRRFFAQKAKEDEQQHDIVRNIIPEGLEESVERVVDAVFLPPPRQKEKSANQFSRKKVPVASPTISRLRSSARPKKRDHEEEGTINWFIGGSQIVKKDIFATTKGS